MKPSSDRRDFIKKGSIYIGTATLAGSLFMCKGENENEKKEGKEEAEVSPPEDLMREHGILNRTLLVYEECISLIKENKDFPPQIISNAALIIREFIEDYHEKQEEDFLFPRFEKAGKLTDLITILRAQHNVGRTITDQVIKLSANGLKSKDDKEKTTQMLKLFIHFYRPHEAREDTVLFPALRSIISKHEFDSLGEEFEKNEHKKFGQDGFELYVNKVADLERQLGIYDLSKFTPDIKNL